MPINIRQIPWLRHLSLFKETLYLHIFQPFQFLLQINARPSHTTLLQCYTKVEKIDDLQVCELVARPFCLC